MKTKYYFINRAEKHLNNGFSFDESDFDDIINELEQENEEYEPITWESLRDALIEDGWKYCYWEYSIVTDTYAKELGLIEDEDDE